MMLKERLLFWCFMTRHRAWRGWTRWKHRNTVVMSEYDRGRIFWRVAEPQRLSEVVPL